MFLILSSFIKQMSQIIPVILAGGSGTRLWPLSTEELPKQFLPLLSSKSLLQETVLRLNGLKNVTPPIVIGNEKHSHIIKEQLDAINIKPQTIFLEPMGRNTAPAIAVAALHSLKSTPGKESIFLVMPADHAIQNLPELHTSIQIAKNYAVNGKLVTFGIKPTRVETGYGYIKFAKQLDNQNAYYIDQFVEKPDTATAQKYVDSEQYSWNSGMFMFTVSTFLNELQQHAPDIHNSCEKILTNASSKNYFLSFQKTDFSNCPSRSIDYAVMEKTKNCVVIQLQNVGWSDIGSWQALWEHGEKDANNNVVIGDQILANTQNSYIHAKGKKVVTAGIQDTIIVATGDKILVIHKKEDQTVKKIIN